VNAIAAGRMLLGLSVVYCLHLSAPIYPCLLPSAPIYSVYLWMPIAHVLKGCQRHRRRTHAARFVCCQLSAVYRLLSVVCRLHAPWFVTVKVCECVGARVHVCVSASVCVLLGLFCESSVEQV
jgi:hypothetical protein